MNFPLEKVGFGIALVALAAGAYAAGRADAAGVPSSEPLYYGGVLEDDGELIEGTRDLTINIWQRVDSTDDSDRLCSADFADTAFSAGRFRVPLPDACFEAVRSKTELWSEIVVDGSPAGRAKIGALPFAVSAEYAAQAVDAQAADQSELDFHVAASATAGNVAVPNGTSNFGDLTITSGGDQSVRLATGMGGASGMTPMLQVFDSRLEVHHLATDNLVPRTLRPRGVTSVSELESPQFESPTTIEASGRLRVVTSQWGNVNLSAGPTVSAASTHDYGAVGGVCPNGGVLVAVRLNSSLRPTDIRCTSP